MADIYPRLHVVNIPNTGVFTLSKSGEATLRFVAYSNSEEIGEPTVSFNDSKIDIKREACRLGVEDGVRYCHFDVRVNRNRMISDAVSIDENVQICLDGYCLTVRVVDRVNNFVGNRSSVFFRSNGERRATLEFVDFAEKVPIRLEFDSKLITAELKQESDSASLIVYRKIDTSFESQVCLWLAGNESDEPDLVIPVYCL